MGDPHLQLLSEGRLRGEDGAVLFLPAVLPSPERHSAGLSRLWRLPPLAASLLLLSAAIGSVVLVGVLAVALVPAVLMGVLILGWLLALALLVWAGIEGLAALERWFENDPRFHR